MKLIILRTNLKEALSAVERAVAENANLPILKNVVIHVDSKIRISATNLEIGVNHYAVGKIQEVGGISVPLSPLYNIIQNSDSERIQLATDKNTLIVKTDNYEAKIQGMSEEEFPLIPKIDDASHHIKISPEILKEALNQIVSAAQVSELKPELSGILFDFQTTILKLVATDSYRLAEKTLLNNAFENTFTKGFRAIVPLRTIQEVTRIFSAGGDIKIFIDPHQILFSSDTTELISRLIDGTYPDYQAIIPKEVENELSLEREHLVTGIKLVSGFSGRTSDIKLRAKKDAKVLEAYSNNQYVGENNYLIPVKRKGAGFDEVSFNWRYLLDGVRSMPTKNISLGVNLGQKPAIIRPDGDNSLFYIVMPLES